LTGEIFPKNRGFVLPRLRGDTVPMLLTLGTNTFAAVAPFAILDQLLTAIE
jgi:hypothetical protein